jgi:hypothetical protein
MFFSFKNFKSTECCLSINGLGTTTWAGLPDLKAQNQKINNEDQKRRKHLNLHKNMMNTRIKPKN